jgi:hypothetical protein
MAVAFLRLLKPGIAGLEGGRGGDGAHQAGERSTLGEVVLHVAQRAGVVGADDAAEGDGRQLARRAVRELPRRLQAADQIANPVGRPSRTLLPTLIVAL